jgi:outer membrane scaffolding protein for murein synthesis (MipA/OmpV family)
MTILNPDEAGLARQDTTVALEAFATATLQWMKVHPNLRIKVKLPPGISEQNMLSIYRERKDRLPASAIISDD